MNGQGILVACVGNIFSSDDGFGSRVAAALRRRTLPDGVRLEDFGIRSVHLVYELMNGYDVLVLVDTVGRQEGPPGSLYVIEPDVPVAADEDMLLNPHDLPPGGVLALVPVLGASVGRILVVGVQPASLEDGIGLSDPVDAAVDPAADLVVEVVSRELERLSAFPPAIAPGGGG